MILILCTIFFYLFSFIFNYKYILPLCFRVLNHDGLGLISLGSGLRRLVVSILLQFSISPGRCAFLRARIGRLSLSTMLLCRYGFLFRIRCRILLCLGGGKAAKLSITSLSLHFIELIT